MKLPSSSSSIKLSKFILAEARAVLNMSIVLGLDVVNDGVLAITLAVVPIVSLSLVLL